MNLCFANQLLDIVGICEIVLENLDPFQQKGNLNLDDFVTMIHFFWRVHSFENFLKLSPICDVKFNAVSQHNPFLC